MLLQQNYHKIAQQTTKIFRLYSKRLFAQALLNAIEKKKKGLFDYRPSQQQNIEPGKVSEPQISIHSCTDRQEEFEEEEVEQPAVQSRNTRTKTFKMTLFEDRKKQLVDIEQVHYGDIVHLARDVKNNADRILCNVLLGNIRGLPISVSKSSNMNLSRTLFLISSPEMEIGYRAAHPDPVRYGDKVCFKHVFSNKYIYVHNNQINRLTFGYETSLNQKLMNRCLFVVKPGLQKFIKNSSYVYTNENIELALYCDQSVKLALEKQRFMRGYEQELFDLVGRSTPNNLTLLKQTTKPNSQFTQMGYYLLRSKNRYLGANQRKIASMIKETTKTIFLDESSKFTITYQSLDSKLIMSELKLIQRKNFKHILLGEIWELHKPALQNSVNIQNTDVVMFYNVLMQEYMVYNKISKKIKVSSDPTEPKEFNLKFCSGAKDVRRYEIEVKDVGKLTLKKNAESLFHVTIVDDSKDTTNFEIIEIKPSQIEEILKFGPINNILFQTHKFLEVWGLAKSKQDDKKLTYSYSKCLKEEYLLRIELQRLSYCLVEIQNYLNSPPKNHRIIESPQIVMKQLKILELLILICRMISLKIEKPKDLLIQTFQIEDSPFEITRKNLEPFLLRVFKILYNIILNNKHCSSVVIQHSQLFNELLLSYPEQVGALLQEAIRNLSSLYGIKNRSEGQEEVFQWVKLITKPTYTNIKTQTIYLQIVAEIVVDPLDNGISTYQNRCKDLLFKQKNGLKYKNLLIEFQLVDKEPGIIFTPEYHDQFHKDNPLLNNCILKSKPAALCYSLESICNLKQQCYVQYIEQVLKLFRNMCRGRNKKVIKMLLELGISTQYIIRVTKNPKINQNIKMKFVGIYVEIYIEQEPFMQFNRVQNKCYIYRKLNEYDLNMKTCLIFRQLTENVDVIKLTKQFDQYILPFIAEYLNEAKIKFEQDVCRQCEYIQLLQMVRLIMSCSNLGYQEMPSIKENISQLISLINLIIEKNTQFEAFRRLMPEILYEIVRLLDLYHQMTINFVCIDFLMYMQQERRKEEHNFSQIESKCEQLIKCQFRIKKRKLTGSVVRGNAKYSSKFFENLEKFYKGDTIQDEITSFLLRVIGLNQFQKFDHGFNLIIDLLERKANMHEQIMQFLKDVLLIVTKEQEDIYDELNGSKINQILNVHKLHVQVTKLRSDMVDEKIKNQILLQISNQLKKLIKKLKLYQQKSKQLFSVAQTILEKMKIYQDLCSLIPLPNPNYKQLISTIYKFLLIFGSCHEANLKLMSKDYRTLISNMQYQQIPELLDMIFDQITNKQQCLNFLFQCLQVGNDKIVILKCIQKILTRNERNLHLLCLRQIISESEFKPFMVLSSGAINIIMLDIISELAHNPQAKSIFRVIFTRQLLFKKIVSQQYQNKGYFLKLYYRLYVKSQILSHQQCQQLIKVFVVEQLSNANYYVDQIVNQRLLLAMKSKVYDFDQEALSKIKQQYQLCLSVIQNLNKKIIISTQKKNLNYWEYFYSFNPKNFSLMRFLKALLLKLETLSLNIRLRNDIKQIVNILREIATKTKIIQFDRIIEDCDYIILLLNLKTNNHPPDYDPENRIVYLRNYLSDFSKFLYMNGISFYELLSTFGIDYNSFVAYVNSDFKLVEPRRISKLQFIDKIKQLEQKCDIQQNLLKIEQLTNFYDVFKSQSKDYFQHELLLKIFQTQNYLKTRSLNQLFQQPNQYEQSNHSLFNSKNKAISLQYIQDPTFNCRVYERLLVKVENTIEEKYKYERINKIKQQFVVQIQKDTNLQLLFASLQRMKLNNPESIIIKHLLIVFLQSNSVKNIALDFDLDYIKLVVEKVQQYPNLLNMNLYRNIFNRKFLELYQLKILNSQVFLGVSAAVVRGCNQMISNKKPEQAKAFIRSIVFSLSKQSSISRKWISESKEFIEEFKERLLDFCFKDCHPYQFNIHLYQITKLAIDIVVGTNDLPKIIQNHHFKGFVMKIYQALPDDFYTFRQQNRSVLQYFTLLMNILIQLQKQKKVEEILEVLKLINFNKLVRILKLNYENNIKPRLKLIETEVQCQNKPDCTDTVCNQGKITSQDRFIFDLLCKVMIIIQIMCHQYKSNKNRFHSSNNIELDQMQNILEVIMGEKIEGPQFLNFYIRFKGRILIVHKQGIHEIHFKKPFICSYLHPLTKGLVMQIINELQPTQISKNLYKLSKFLQEELIMYKYYISYHLLNLLLKYRQIVQNTVFVIIFLINYTLLMVVVRTQAQYTHIPFSILMLLITLLKILYSVMDTISMLNQLRIFKKTNYDFGVLQNSQFALGWLQIAVCFISIFAISWIPMCTILEALRFEIIRMMMGLIVRQRYTIFKLFIYLIVFTTSCTIYFQFKLERNDYFNLLGELSYEVIDGIFNGKLLDSSALFFVDPSSIFIYYLFVLVNVFITAFFVKNIIYRFMFEYKQTKENQERCKICHKSIKQVEESGTTMRRHFKDEHNLWNYLYYFIYLGKKEQIDMDATQRNIQNSIKAGDWAFLHFK